MTRSRRIIIAAFAAVVLLAGWAWFSPSGTGEYADSPDGRYQAWASNYRRGTWLHGRVSYIAVEITERGTGKAVWRVERYPLAGETPPEFGDRSRTFIRWATDSRSVSVPVGSAADAVWMVP